MRVLVDPEAFRHGRCGVTRYFAAVCEGLRSAGIDIDLPLVASMSDYKPVRRWLGRIGPAPAGDRILRAAARVSRRLYHSRLASGRYDVILPTSSHYETDFLQHARGRPFLLVCFDTIRSLPVPGGAIDAWSDPLHRLLYLARRAARVVCISATTRQDLMRSIPLPPEKVSIVRCANLLPKWAPVGTAVSELPEKYFLFVGSRQVRKNFDGTIRALAPLLQRGDGLKLVCTGQLNIWERDLVDALDLTGRVTGLNLSDAELVTAYERAIALVFPSFYEGFGLPVLEAMACGCPVIASNTSSLPEVAGDAALLIDPANGAELLSAATRISGDQALRARLVVAGREQAARFSFDVMIRELIEQLHAAASTVRRRDGH